MLKEMYEMIIDARYDDEDILDSVGVDVSGGLEIVFNHTANYGTFFHCVIGRRTKLVMRRRC